MRWAGHMARSEQGRNAYRALVANMRERDNLEYIGLNERMILKMIFKQRDRGMYLVYMDQERDSWPSFFAYGNEYFQFSKIRGIY